jgi:TetR/AcrR family transcriptional repressor of nem operon
MATATQIIDIAQEYVQKVGFHAFSYRDIAERVGIRTASIHYHFPTKADLAKAIVDRVLAATAAAVAEIDATTGSASERLRRFCGLFLQTWGEGDRLCPMCMLAMGQDAIPGDVQSGVRDFWRGGEQWVAQTVRDGQAAGEFIGDLRPEAVGRTFVAALEGGMVAARAFSDRTRIADVIDHLIGSVTIRRTDGAGAV